MTNWNVILSISKTHLLSRLKQTSIAALGVTFGIGAFIILMSFMTGLNGMLDGLILDRTPHVHIYKELTPSETQPIELTEAFKGDYNIIHSIKPKFSQTRIHNALPLLKYLRQHEGVLGATPQVKAQVFYIAGAIELNGMLIGVDLPQENNLFNLDDYITRGDPLSLTRIDNGILLGAGLAKKMSVQIGDRIQVTSIQGERFPLKIVGIYQSGLAEIDDSQSYVSLKTAQRVLAQPASYITDINVKLHDIEEAVPMARYIRNQYKLSAFDIKAANAQFETGTKIRNMITYAVSATLLLVAGFGIYNILNMVIYEKINDIAILRAMGFSGSDVKYIFISQAMIIGFFGGLLGLLIGFGISVVIDHTPFETEALPTITTFPVNFNPLFYAVGVFVALSATFLAGYLPAHRAQKIDPVDIIRGR